MYSVLSVSLVLNCLVLFSIHASEEPKTYRTKDGLTCLQCQPGTYFVEDCTLERHSANCIECQEGHFQKQHNRATSCQPCKSHCNKNFVINNTCSRVSDNTCHCTEGFYLHDVGGENEKKCLKNKICPAGHGLKFNEQTSKQECEECPDGTFSVQINGSQYCKKYTVCATGSTQEESGSKIEDVKCVPNTESVSVYKEYPHGGTVIALAVLLSVFFVITIIEAVCMFCPYCRKKFLINMACNCCTKCHNRSVTRNVARYEPNLQEDTLVKVIA